MQTSVTVERFIEENRDDLSTNRYWYIREEGAFTEEFVDSSEYCQAWMPAYWDYFGNGGCNRHILSDAIRAVRALGVIPRGSIASRCLTVIARYQQGIAYLPDNMESMFETVLDALGNAQIRGSQ